MPIESIDLPAMPIGEFVNLMSSMAAVPIKLDPKVLGDVGLSSRTTVTVRGDNTTVGKLLAGVLKEHHSPASNATACWSSSRRSSKPPSRQASCISIALAIFRQPAIMSSNCLKFSDW